MTTDEQVAALTAAVASLAAAVEEIRSMPRPGRMVEVAPGIHVNEKCIPRTEPVE
jgi:hypothetical protein